MKLTGRQMVKYADEQFVEAGYLKVASYDGVEMTVWSRSFDRLPGCICELRLFIDTGKRAGATMVLWPSLRLEESFLEHVLPSEVYARLVEVLGRGTDSLKIEELRLLNEKVKKGSRPYFGLTTELFDQYFVPGVREFDRAADLVAQSRESLRACALEPRLGVRPPLDIQQFQFRGAALLLATLYGRDAFDDVVSEYRSLKDAGHWMHSESDESLDDFVKVVDLVPEESWAAMRAGGQ
ncbi:Hypothetical protein BJL86_2974 [Dietzia timorensis]|uniref:Uncharacterized protein n=2 Tax=Dietzia timorensis TaxID=499555 RepID=A0A173LPA4_9ACTN|nr:Hypothetical protein BJL86_2974 [Dietzia timorensis]